MDDITFHKENHVAIIRLDRPTKLNAVHPAMARRLDELARECNDDSNIRCVVVTGTGRAFCVGTDVGGLDDRASPWELRNREDYCGSVWNIKKPTVAAINGLALGGGLELALSCDIRVASENASFGAPEIKLGWIGGGGMSAFLSLAAGPGNAARMIMTGDTIDAETALTWGIVSELFSSEELDSSALVLAETIASRAPVAAMCAKDNLRAVPGMNIEMSIQYERDLQTICFATNDADEGRAAFAEKREPRFNGT